MKQYKAIAKAVVATGLLAYANFDNAVEVKSGWWDAEEKAVSELEYELEHQLQSGLYHIQTIIIKRKAA